MSDFDPRGVEYAHEVIAVSIREAVKEGLLDDDALIIAIERGDRMVTPNGTTNVRPDDIVTVLSRGGDTDRILDSFIAGEVPPER
ncbi:MAG: TrkA C-terminal domain-containing protein [Haloarculaceae archaeon]